MAEIEDRGPQLAAVAAALLGLAIAPTLLRAYVRIGVLRAFGADDWLMIVALVSYILNTVCCIQGTKYGTGRHYWDLTPEGTMAALKYWWFCYLTYATTMIAAKLSIGLFLLRITASRTHKYIIYAAMGSSIVFGTAFFFVAMLQCHPVEFFWDRSIPGGTCIDVEAIILITYVYSSISIVTDFTFALLPIFMVLQLQMDVKTKLALVPILSIGCVSAVAVRLAYVNDFRTQDFLYATTDIAIWSQTEQGLAIAAASLATLRPLLRHVLTRLGLTSNESYIPHSTIDDQPTKILHRKQSRGTIGSALTSTTMSQADRSSNSRGKPQNRGHRSVFSLTTFKKMGAESIHSTHGDHDADNDHFAKEMFANQLAAPAPAAMLPPGRLQNSSQFSGEEGEYRVTIASGGSRSGKGSRLGLRRGNSGGGGVGNESQEELSGSGGIRVNSTRQVLTYMTV